MIDLKIRDSLQERVQEALTYILSSVSGCTVFLFGSYATRKIKKNSDIDLLVLLKEPMNQRQLRELRIQLANDFEERIQYRYEVDIKIYNEDDFYKKARSVSFESAIQDYMIKVGETE